MWTALPLLLWLCHLRFAAPFMLKGTPLEASPFNNTLLVVHCRLKIHGLDPLVVCAEREPLYDGYKKYFAELHFLTGSECPRSGGDPHKCVARLMKGPGANRDGIFYMHFDSIIRPRHLGPTFDVTKMFSFNERRWCEINKTTLGQEHCGCTWWSLRRANSYQDAIYHLRNSTEPAFAGLDPWQFWIGNDDMFYVPKSVYALYDKLASAFFDVHHEIAGPTMRTILESLTSVPLLSLGCTGSCCAHLGSELLLQPDFKCGHAFDLSKEETRDTFPRAISTYREVVPLEVWRQAIELVLA